MSILEYNYKYSEPRFRQILSRAAPILVSVSVSGQYQHIFMVSESVTSTNSVVRVILSIKLFFKVIKLK